MTLKELIEALEYKRKGLAYRLWKNGMLNQWLEHYPDSSYEASPELYPPPKTIKKPSCLNNSNLIKRGAKMYYE